MLTSKAILYIFSNKRGNMYRLIISIILLFISFNFLVANNKKKKVKCIDVIGYLYYVQPKKYEFISIPVIDKNGNMIKCK